MNIFDIPETEAERKVEANTYEWYNELHPIIEDEEKEGQWYYVVFKPMNRPYEEDPSWYLYMGIDNCRKKLLSPSRYILTLERLDVAKAHINALCRSDKDLHNLLNGRKYLNKYYMTVIPVEPGIANRERVLQYILKESSKRTFKLYRDVLFYNRKVRRTGAPDGGDAHEVGPTRGGVLERCRRRDDSPPLGETYLSLWP